MQLKLCESAARQTCWRGLSLFTCDNRFSLSFWYFVLTAVLFVCDKTVYFATHIFYFFALCISGRSLCFGVIVAFVSTSLRWQSSVAPSVCWIHRSITLLVQFGWWPQLRSCVLLSVQYFLYNSIIHVLVLIIFLCALHVFFSLVWFDISRQIQRFTLAHKPLALQLKNGLNESIQTEWMTNTWTFSSMCSSASVQNIWMLQNKRKKMHISAIAVHLVWVPNAIRKFVIF